MAFKDFPRQQRTVDLLQRSLSRGRLGHAYLFSGDSIAELEAVARTLAKTLNCLKPPVSGPDGTGLDCCDQCANCRRIEESNHPDVWWVRAESKSRVIRIDQIRDLLQTIYLKPTEAQFKVAVLVAADRLNPHAANAFLKTLEEPPAKSVLILLATDTQKIPDTIVSRCLRLTFAGEPGVRNSASQEWLRVFAESAAEGSHGLLGRYRLLGSLLSKLNTEKSGIEETLSSRSPIEKYSDLEPDLREKFEDELTAAVEAEYRRQRGEILTTLEWWLRDIWLKTLGIAGEMRMFPALAGATERIAGRIAPAQALENIQVLEETQRLLASNVQEALVLEVGLIRLTL